jgi:N,N-dimethylformamidase
MKRLLNHDAMAVVGYTTPWTVADGGTVDLHLSCSALPDAVTVRRLDTPERPVMGWPVQSLAALPEHRSFDQGSYLKIGRSELRKAGGATGVRFELFLTGNDGERTLVDAGALALTVTGERLSVSHAGRVHDTGIDLPPRIWLDVSLALGSSAVAVEIHSRDLLAPFEAVWSMDAVVEAFGDHDLLLGSDAGFKRRCLNARFSSLAIDTPAGTVRWQFPTILPDGAMASSAGPGSLMLEAVNLPTFCVASRRWDGSTFDPRLAPSHYDAVHCHDDDMGSLGWPASYRIDVPADAPSGVYAFEVSAGGATEQVVFFVAARKPAASLVFVVPTATYLAYADELLPKHLYPWQCDDRAHRLAIDNDFRSLYDFHNDLSGVSICTFEKPKATLREDYRYPLGDCPHNLPVDLHFLRFCRTHGVEIDVITDHDLHLWGVEGLNGYSAVVTGSHPEYLSVEMEGAYRAFAARGGSIAYLGGNGFAGTVAFRDDILELRRSPLEAGRTWDGPVGEQAFAINNEPGGHLRSRGRGEFSLTGVAISLMGFGRGRPFSRVEEGYHADHAWLFQGVESETFGADGIVLGAAAGYEVDATDWRMGTARDTRVVARATDFPDSFFHDPSRWYAGGEAEMAGRRCAEMTVRYLTSGGLIFSASSVAWLGALPSGSDMNDVGRITLNLLDRISGISREAFHHADTPPTNV